MTELKKRDLLFFYGGAYLVIAILEGILFTLIIGSWAGIDLLFNFSVWGLVWLISMFAYPMFFMDARDHLALNGTLALLGYVIIIGGYILAYYLHKMYLTKKLNEDLSFKKVLDLYFPTSKE
ncbi:MAG: hypothetical protein HGN29_10335 [Asgard group archaeon]|nr:hypothetical protein [Asgard group archaeon]